MSAVLAGAADEQGWWNPQPFSSRSKFHYVGSDGRSLCGKWLYFKGDLDNSKDDHPDNCAACQRKRKAAK
jgi:hypothetical protein